MKHIFIILFLLFPMCALANTIEKSSISRSAIGNPNRLLITGDSIAFGDNSTISWRERLAAEIGNKYYFVGEWGLTVGTTNQAEMTHENSVFDLGYTWDGWGNSGHSSWSGTYAFYGVTDRSVLERVETREIVNKWFPNPTSRTDDIVMLEVGTNDALFLLLTPTIVIDEGIDPFVTYVKSVSSNITTIILSLLWYDDDVVPPDTGEEADFNARLTAVNDAYIAYALAEDDVEYIDIRTSLESCWVILDEGACTDDGLHPNDVGAAIIKDDIVAGLRSLGLIN